MIDEGQQEQLRQEQIKAAESEQVLQNPQFKAACEYVDAMLRESRRQVPIRDTAMHTQLIQMEQIWQRFVGFLEESLTTGRLANLQLQQEETRMEWLRNKVASITRR